VVRYIYERNDISPSRFGNNGSAARVSDVARELRENSGLTQTKVQSNLTYLIDRGWG
jgi:DNA-binding MarR family transcriptional regulator